jgi:hypothetical protein
MGSGLEGGVLLISERRSKVPSWSSRRANPWEYGPGEPDPSGATRSVVARSWPSTDHYLASFLLGMRQHDVGHRKPLAMATRPSGHAR